MSKEFKEYSLWNHGNSAHIFWFTNQAYKRREQKDASWTFIIHTINFIVN